MQLGISARSSTRGTLSRKHTPVLCWFNPPLVAIIKYRFGWVLTSAAAGKIMQFHVRNKNTNWEETCTTESTRQMIDQRFSVFRIQKKHLNVATQIIQCIGRYCTIKKKKYFKWHDKIQSLLHWVKTDKGISSITVIQSSRTFSAKLFPSPSRNLIWKSKTDVIQPIQYPYHMIRHNTPHITWYSVILKKFHFIYFSQTLLPP